MNPELTKNGQWKAGYDDVRLEQMLAFASLSANDKLEPCQEHMPKRVFLESW